MQTKATKASRDERQRRRPGNAVDEEREERRRRRNEMVFYVICGAVSVGLAALVLLAIARSGRCSWASRLEIATVGRTGSRRRKDQLTKRGCGR